MKTKSKDKMLNILIDVSITIPKDFKDIIERTSNYHIGNHWYTSASSKPEMTVYGVQWVCKDDPAEINKYTIEILTNRLIKNFELPLQLREAAYILRSKIKELPSGIYHSWDVKPIALYHLNVKYERVEYLDESKKEGRP